MKYMYFLLFILIFACSTNEQKYKHFQGKVLKCERLKPYIDYDKEWVRQKSSWKEIFYIDGDCPKCLPTIKEFIEIKEINFKKKDEYCFILILSTVDLLSLTYSRSEFLDNVIVYITQDNEFVDDNHFESIGNGFSIIVNGDNKIVELSKGFISNKRRNEIFCEN